MLNADSSALLPGKKINSQSNTFSGPFFSPLKPYDTKQGLWATKSRGQKVFKFTHRDRISSKNNYYESKCKTLE